MKVKSQLIVGLDIGTTKVCTIVGKNHPEGIEIIGFGVCPSRGIKKGVVVNIENTVDSIRKVIEEAETMSGCRIQSVFAGIAGTHIKGFNSQGVIAIKDGEVKKQDIRKAIEAAKTIAIPVDREIIHTLPQEFVVDEQDGIEDPLGMSAMRLEARIYIITGASNYTQNIIRCANKTGLTVEDIVFQPLASSYSALTEDEKELGVALIDIGGGTTDIAIFYRGCIRFTSVIPIAGEHLTTDIAVGIHTSLSEAENIKKRYGCLIEEDEDLPSKIEVSNLGNEITKEVSISVLKDIVNPRIEELFSLIHAELRKSGFYKLLSAGIVFTGGTSLLKGIIKKAEQFFRLPVRIGYPKESKDLPETVCSPMYATGVGLLYYARQIGLNGGLNGNNKGPFLTIGRKIKQWFEEAF